MHLVEHLVRAGYIVAAPDYPLSSRAAYTRITAADTTDVVNQVKDIHFIIDRLLADANLSPLIDRDRIATMGHSLGAVTSYFASFAGGIRDPRIKATVLLGAGDPVQAALSANMGLTGTWHVAASVPVLFLSAEHDVFANITGRPHAAYMRLESPKYEIMVHGGVHVWFRDGSDKPADGSNPDCRFFANGPASAFKPRGCEPGAKLIEPLRQQEITRIATVAFLDGYLKGDRAQLERLRTLPATLQEIDELSEN
jgi:predicted dienelactone hydrolase